MEKKESNNDFEKELTALINKYSKENDSDTPDFLLAHYLMLCLSNFSVIMKIRDTWYGSRSPGSLWDKTTKSLRKLLNEGKEKGKKIIKEKILSKEV
jgi:hypothetical protein